MVTFIPPYMGEEIKSNAEKKMYDVLQQLDMGTWQGRTPMWST